MTAPHAAGDPAPAPPRPTTPETGTDPHDSGRFWLLCLITGILLTGFLVILVSDLPFVVRRFVSDVGLLSGGVAAALSCGLRRRGVRGNRRWAWTCLALAGVTAAVGNGWVLIVHLNDYTEAAADWGNLGFGLALALGLVALLIFPAVRRRGLDLVRILFDGIVVGGALLSIVGLTIFPQLLEQASTAGSSPAGGLLTVVVDVTIATLAAMLVVRGDRADRTVLILLGLGGACYAIAELSRAALSAREEFSFGGPVDLGWMAGYAAFALAARYPDRRQGRLNGSTGTGVAATPASVSTSLTFGAFLIAALVRVYRLPEAGSTVLNSTIWVAVLFAVTIRQALLIIDNDRLRHDLERRVVERTHELERLTRTSQTMLASVGDGIYGVDADGRITFANPSAADLLGYPENELIGASAHDLFHAPDSDGHRFPYAGCYIAEAIREGTVSASEEDLYQRKDGARFPTEVTASPLVLDDVVAGAVVVFRDVTQRREIETMKSEFVSVVSHELRTPMTSIRGSLGLLSAGALGELSPAAGRMVRIALDSSERMTRLINDILDIERIESGTMPMEFGRIEAADLVADRRRTGAHHRRVRRRRTADHRRGRRDLGRW